MIIDGLPVSMLAESGGRVYPVTRSRRVARGSSDMGGFFFRHRRGQGCLELLFDLLDFKIEIIGSAGTRAAGDSRAGEQSIHPDKMFAPGSA